MEFSLSRRKMEPLRAPLTLRGRDSQKISDSIQPSPMSGRLGPPSEISSKILPRGATTVRSKPKKQKLKNVVKFQEN
jgi:hypothetical protein